MESSSATISVRPQAWLPIASISHNDTQQKKEKGNKNKILEGYSYLQEEQIFVCTRPKVSRYLYYTRAPSAECKDLTYITSSMHILNNRLLN